MLGILTLVFFNALTLILSNLKILTYQACLFNDDVCFLSRVKLTSSVWLMMLNALRLNKCQRLICYVFLLFWAFVFVLLCMEPEPFHLCTYLLFRHCSMSYSSAALNGAS